MLRSKVARSEGSFWNVESIAIEAASHRYCAKSQQPGIHEGRETNTPTAFLSCRRSHCLNSPGGQKIPQPVGVAQTHSLCRAHSLNNRRKGKGGFRGSTRKRPQCRIYKKFTADEGGLNFILKQNNGV